MGTYSVLYQKLNNVTGTVSFILLQPTKHCFRTRITGMTKELRIYECFSGRLENLNSDLETILKLFEKHGMKI